MSTPDRPTVRTKRANATISPPSARQRGISLVELIMFIVIVGIGVAGLLLVFSTTTKSSGDPLIQKQMLSIAEALLEEVQSRPFTYCDPDDANAATAAGAGDCTGGAGGPNDESRSPLGPEAGETRATFDNVSDYNGLSLSPVSDVAGNPIGGLGAYGATIAVAQAALGTVAAADSLQITVTVDGPGNEGLALQGFRTRYAPNALP